MAQEQSVNEIHPFAPSWSLGEVAMLWIPASAGAGAGSRHGGVSGHRVASWARLTRNTSSYL